MSSLYQHLFIRFPNLKSRIEEQLALDEEFREVCLDYEELAHFMNSADPEKLNASNSQTELGRVMKELETEILEYLLQGPSA